MGKAGALGPGGYDPDVKYEVGSPKKVANNRISSLSKKGAA